MQLKTLYHEPVPLDEETAMSITTQVRSAIDEYAEQSGRAFPTNDESWLGTCLASPEHPDETREDQRWVPTLLAEDENAIFQGPLSKVISNLEPELASRLAYVVLREVHFAQRLMVGDSIDAGCHPRGRSEVPFRTLGGHLA